MPERPPCSASDSVFLGIVRGLEIQTFVPGQRLVEADLADQFGVGRNSVREALQRLAAEGIVELLRHRGAAIRSLSLRETLDVLDVAERMTGLLGRAAARACAGGASTCGLQAALQELAAADPGDLAGFSAARRHFYRALLDLAGNQELRRLFPTIHVPVVHAQYRLPTLQKIRQQDYGRIAAAVLAGDAEAAEAAGGEHVRHVRDAICAAS